MKLLFTLALSVASFSPMVFSQVERDMGSHEHGSATLNIAVDNAALIIELDTPWNNIVGFEHAPHDDEQQALVEAALERLRQPEQLFSFVGGNCTFDVLDMENAMPGGKQDDDHHESSHDEESHDEHEEQHEEDHQESEEHAQDAKGGEKHSTVLVSYAYNCADIASLSTISIEFFKIWPGFTDLDVQLIGPGGQSLAELNAELPVLDVTPVQ